MAVKKSELYSILWEACNKLRGGVEPARYKDYVLTLLFFKYVSDRYKGQPYAALTVPPDKSFDALSDLKGTKDVAERVDIILQSFKEENDLLGSLPDVNFNNPAELGSGETLVDKVSGLIAVFENPAIDFRTNRASGDDIIGDAYEYFMMKFAQESGKSKGQFYTPSEVSRIIARLIGIGGIQNTPDKKWTIYDPAAGSGSLLIRADDEAPVGEDGKSIVSIYAQENDNSTAGLAKMNFVLHQKATAEIAKGNTLAAPAFKDRFGQELRQFDFVVMNPPFSDKDWSDGLKASADPYKRFEGFGVPPEKNGDYAWFLHVVKSMNSAGKAGIVMPHGVLFRGNAEETIRRKVLEKRYIKGIVSLPINLFYGTGIAACLVFLDKEDADSREGIFFIDASDGFKKDGNKNRLREQDIEKIVRTFQAQDEIIGYSHMVPYSVILSENDGNLNVSRYIQKIDGRLPQNIASHLYGGIPKYDIETLEKLWRVSPVLKNTIFTRVGDAHDIYNLALAPEAIDGVFEADTNLQAAKAHEGSQVFAGWMDGVKDILLGIDGSTNPKTLIRQIGSMMLEDYAGLLLLDKYDVYDCLMNYWNEKLQDDVYAIRAAGYEKAGRSIEYEYGQKKVTMDGKTVSVKDETKIKSFDGALIPRDIIEYVYFDNDREAIADLTEERNRLDSELEETREEESGDDGLLKEILDEKGEISKSSLYGRIVELDKKRTSQAVVVLEAMLSDFASKDEKVLEKIAKKTPLVEKYDVRNKNGTFSKAKLKVALKAAKAEAAIPEVYREEYDALLSYRDKFDEKEDLSEQIKQVRKELDDKVRAKYDELTEEEIKHLLFDKKWMPAIHAAINSELDRLINSYAARVVMIAKRYEHTLKELEDRTEKSKAAVREAMKRMGYAW